MLSSVKPITSRLSRLPPQLQVTPNYSLALNQVKKDLFQSRRATSYQLREDKTRFKMCEQIGKGNFSKVIRVENQGCSYALKIMEKKFIHKMNMKSQILKEIEIQSLIKHQHIVALIGTFEDQDNTYLITEYCEKGNIFNKLFDSTTIKKIISQVLLALQHLHKFGIMHRDIKPENIYITKDNNFKLGDFGCSNYKRQRRRTFCGTLDYMSPEMVTCGGKIDGYSLGYDERTDIWSIGILLYELINGYSPFKDRDQSFQMRKICSETIVYPQNMDQNSQDFIDLCLQRDPNKRPSISNLLQHSFITTD